jgi:hypothetical protein
MPTADWMPPVTLSMAALRVDGWFSAGADILVEERCGWLRDMVGWLVEFEMRLV